MEMTLKVDENGRVELPAAMQKKFRLRQGDEVVLMREGDEFLFKIIPGLLPPPADKQEAAFLPEMVTVDAQVELRPKKQYDIDLEITQVKKHVPSAAEFTPDEC